MLELKNIVFEVTDDDGNIKRIIDNISLTLGDDKYFVITGPNGSGKSTLARIIMGIEQPTSGQIIFDGIDITNKTITERANLGISFALQQPVRFKGIKVSDIIKLSSGRDLTTIEACDYLSAVGLCARDYIDREVNSSLSGGELKRIEIASVLARGTKLSLFDEPEAGIDLWSFQNLIKVFENIKEQMHGTVLIISHQERILNIADEIIILDGGKVSKRGKREELLVDILGASLEGGLCSRMNMTMGKEDC
ncbi:MAG: ATP-binding cassette domain-containing protein [Clostridiales bacterium]|nr:ATP-binding cassette domain-containing protein [Clostridiales bacterium]MDD6539475.1 ATP-binding cassette domain-containing protein [Bacillota bacterium]MDD7016096.1 ATP-binding cassette domain-containing protein [Bacillota bacterium]MDY4959389.1 ATP-binding cassette domain-containing protein [Lentihominibacter sp.]